MSKAKLAKIYPDFNPTCDKCPSVDGSLICSLFWLCPSLELIWKFVFDTQVYTVCLKSTMYNSNAFASLIACLAFLLKCKEATPPTQSKWLSDLMPCLKLKEIQYFTRKSSKTYYKGYLVICNRYLSHIFSEVVSE